MDQKALIPPQLFDKNKEAAIPLVSRDCGHFFGGFAAKLRLLYLRPHLPSRRERKKSGLKRCFKPNLQYSIFGAAASPEFP
jgi:hypothetical protein